MNDDTPLSSDSLTEIRRNLDHFYALHLSATLEQNGIVSFVEGINVFNLRLDYLGGMGVRLYVRTEDVTVANDIINPIDAERANMVKNAPWFPRSWKRIVVGIILLVLVFLTGL